MLFLLREGFYLKWIGFNAPTWAVLVVILLLCWVCWRNTRFVKLIDAIPGPKGIPILGNILQVNVDQVGKVLSLYSILKIERDGIIGLSIEFLRMIHREWVENHGDIYRGWGGTRAIVCIASPELMEVLMTFYESFK